MFCYDWIKYMLVRFRNQCILLFTFYTVFKLFGNWICNTLYYCLPFNDTDRKHPGRNHFWHQPQILKELEIFLEIWPSFLISATHLQSVITASCTAWHYCVSKQAPTEIKTDLCWSMLNLWIGHMAALCQSHLFTVFVISLLLSNAAG